MLRTALLCRSLLTRTPVTSSATSLTASASASASATTTSWPPLLLLSPSAAPFNPTVGQIRSRHSRKDQRDRYFILRDPPLGPYKKLPPNVKQEGRKGSLADYHKIIHWPEDGKYTIKPLQITKLSGRDPLTGQKVINRVGGGAKRRYRWIDWIRFPKHLDPDGPDYEERVVEVRYDPMRKAKIALTGNGSHLRWLIATENMKVGDLIYSSGRMPKTPVKPVEGNSYPLAALPVGTTICLTEFLPGDFKQVKMYRAEDCGKILRKEGKRVVIQDSIGRDYSLDQSCHTVVGKVSIHPLKAAHIGTPNRMRWLGIMPGSGFWQRKTGRFGRKNRKPPPVQVVEPEEPEKDTELFLTHPEHGRRGMKRGKRRKLNMATW